MWWKSDRLSFSLITILKFFADDWPAYAYTGPGYVYFPTLATHCLWESLRIELLWGQKSCKWKNMPFPLLWMTASYSADAVMKQCPAACTGIKCSIGDLVMMVKRNCWLDSKPTFDSVPRILNVVKYHRDYLLLDFLFPLRSWSSHLSGSIQCSRKNWTKTELISVITWNCDHIGLS